MRPRIVNFTASATLIAGLFAATLPAFAQENADFEKGVAAFEVGKYADAIALWEPLAEEGNVDALQNLAQLYRLGLGVQQDDEKAHDLFKKAAEQGSDDAQVNLAFLLVTGKGVEQDREKAAGWFAKAADQGNALAQYNLGMMYEKGLGVDRDPEFAKELYRVAADSGQQRAVARLEALEEASASAEEMAAQREAEKKAAEQELAELEAAKKRADEEEKRAEAVIAKAKAEKESKRPILSIKPVEPKEDPAKNDTAKADPKADEKDDRPVINVVRTPTRKPGERVADAPKGDEPTTIYLDRVNSELDDGSRDTDLAAYQPPPSAPATYTSTADMRMPSDPKARMMMAETAYRGGDFATTAKVLAPLADAGMPHAQFWMGRLYNRGEGVGLNRAEAYSLWRSAAAGGSQRAATALANLASRLSPEEIAIAEQRHASSGRVR